MTISIEAMATLKPPQLHCFSCFYFILLYFFGNQRELFAADQFISSL